MSQTAAAVNIADSKADNPIDAMIDFDRAAREKVAAAQKAAEKLTADALARKKELRDGNAERLAEATDEKFAETRRRTDADIARYESAAEEKCRMLDEKMSENGEGWKKEILGRIIKVN